MKHSGWLIFTIAFLLLPAAGSCSRPQIASLQQTGEPPKVVQIVADSEQEKNLRAAGDKWHEDFVQPLDNQGQSAPKSAPAAAPANDGSATPTAPRPAPAAAPETPATPAAPATPSGGPAPVPAQPAAAAPMAPAAAPATPAAAPMQPTADPGTTPAAPPGNSKKVTASSQAGRKGKEFGNGLIATPIGAYFGTRERIAIMNMEEQLKLWSTQNERPPRDLKEFMEVIIKPAQIKLPALRKGERYIFDPKQGPHGTLLIEQPAEPEK